MGITNLKSKVDKVDKVDPQFRPSADHVLDICALCNSKQDDAVKSFKCPDCEKCIHAMCLINWSKNPPTGQVSYSCPLCESNAYSQFLLTRMKKVIDNLPIATCVLEPPVNTALISPRFCRRKNQRKK